MNKKHKKILKTLLPLLLGVFLIWYSLNNATPQERHELWENIKLADINWILLSLFLGLLSHLSRAHRWKYLLQPLNYKPSFLNRFMAVMAGYLANLGVPRSGELLRGASISTYEKIPFNKAFGTIVSERIADLLMLLLLVVIGLMVQTDNLLAYLRDQNINPLFTIAFFFLLVVLGVLFLLIIKKSKWPLMVKIRSFARGLLEGMRSILKMRHKWLFLFHTIFIWAMYLLMFTVIKYAIPGTSAMGLEAIMAGFIVGSFAVSTTNGGIGVYPLAVGAILIYFGIDSQAGKAFGWIVWGTQTLLVIVLGGISLLLLPVFNQRK